MAAGATLADVLPPTDAFSRSIVQNYVADATGGLPEAQTFPTRGYRPKLSLDYISQPTVGAGYDPYYSSGFGLSGGISMLFSDQLSDNVLGVAVAANGTLKDIGGQALYYNRGGRLNYGAIVGRIPYLQAFRGYSPGTDPYDYVTTYYYRTTITNVTGLVAYPFNQSQRIEAQAGVQRYAYDLEYDQLLDVNDDGFADSYQRTGLDGLPDPINLAEAGVAYVGDTSLFGFTSPIRGTRYRFGADITTGSLTFASPTIDARHYEFLRPSLLPRRVPLTFAVRALHVGRYGPDASSGRLTPIFLGNGQLVRGYSYQSFNFETADQQNAFYDDLFGSRVAVASAELRLPLFGVPQLGLINFPYLPTELVFFGDAGFAWGEAPYFGISGLQDGVDLDDLTCDVDVRCYGAPFKEQVPIFSAGVSARVNVLGALIVEPYYAFPFSRWGVDGDLPKGRGVFGFTLSPGW